MAIRSVTICFVLVFAAVVLLGSVAYAENLVIPGSGNPEYALARLADVFNAQRTQHKVEIPTSVGTAGALREVEAGRASLARVGRPLKADEIARGLVYVPLGRDPVVFVAGAGVTARAITSEQVLAVYRGKVTDWEELGGKPGPIRAIGREVSDASRQAISRHLTPFGDMDFSGGIKVVHLDPQLVDLLDRYPTSLGFLNSSAINACQSKVVRLAFDAVEPTVGNMEKGLYPLWLEFGLIYKPGALTPAGKEFLDFARSPAAAQVLRDLGVLPVAATP